MQTPRVTLPPRLGESNPAPAPPAMRCSSAELFRGHERLVIEHRGEEYLLRITRQGKLILTK